MTEMLAGDDLWLPQTASMIKFRELRCQLSQALAIDESTIGPQTRLAAIVPPHRRSEILSLLTHPDRWALGQRQAEAQHQPDALHQPEARGKLVKLRRLPAWLIEIPATALLSLLCLFQPCFLAMLMLPVTILVANLWRGPRSTIWPNCFETMQQLAISQTHYNKEDAAAGLWPRDEISAKVRWIIAYQLGYRFDEITEETSLLELC
jgi:hypothetical protein